MFYDKQPKENKERYKKMLSIIGSLSNIFADSKQPMLYYRAHENIFCKYLEAENLARKDCSADAKKEKLGVGLNTWVDTDDQKVAEFGRVKSQYDTLEGIELVKKISEFRNLRIQTTMNLYGLNNMIYHIVKRIPNAMEIYEIPFDEVNIEQIRLLNKQNSKNNTWFTDGKHEYHFSSSKNTLYMVFNGMKKLDSFEVEILADPYNKLLELFKKDTSVESAEETVKEIIESKPKKEQLCLRLYSFNKRKGKFVGDKSGLNQWNASGRPRNMDELYIPYPSVDRNRVSFFPPRDTSFKLILPDGKIISAKVCQENSKAIMSNPNKELGHWLLRDVLKLKEGQLVTYDMLKIYDIDSVIFTKLGDLKYSIDFCSAGTYEKYYGLSDADEDNN